MKQLRSTVLVMQISEQVKGIFTQHKGGISFTNAATFLTVATVQEAKEEAVKYVKEKGFVQEDGSVLFPTNMAIIITATA